MCPLLVPEQLIHCFKFIESHGRLNDGMRYRSEIYKQIAVLKITQANQAYSLAGAMRYFGCNVVITRSQAHYRVWIKLGYNTNLLPQA